MITPFNPEGKEVLTYGECLRPAMEIMDPADAKQYLADYVVYIERALMREPRSDDMTAAQIAGINIGYFAGYYDHETRKRVERLFECSHPVFGPADKDPVPAQRAFTYGYDEGKQSK